MRPPNSRKLKRSARLKVTEKGRSFMRAISAAFDDEYLEAAASRHSGCFRSRRSDYPGIGSAVVFLARDGAKLIAGETLYIGKPFYKKYTAAPIKLQAHGDASEPISFRNIWVRELN